MVSPVKFGSLQTIIGWPCVLLNGRVYCCSCLVFIVVSCLVCIVGVVLCVLL